MGLASAFAVESARSAAAERASREETLTRSSYHGRYFTSFELSRTPRARSDNLDRMATRRLAVLVNRNAQRVSPRTIARVSALVAPNDLFLTSSMEAAREAASVIVERGYEALCVGGG